MEKEGGTHVAHGCELGVRGGFIEEPDAIVAARERAHQLGCSTIGPSTGSALRLLAAAAQARTVVEVGSGAGVASLWLLEGMPRDGVLTTIDPDPAHQRAVKQAFSDAGVTTHRTRAITGDPDAVLPASPMAAMTSLW